MTEREDGQDFAIIAGGLAGMFLGVATATEYESWGAVITCLGALLGVGLGWLVWRISHV